MLNYYVTVLITYDIETNLNLPDVVFCLFTLVAEKDNFNFFLGGQASTK